jgi:hypothetical protein
MGKMSQLSTVEAQKGRSIVEGSELVTRGWVNESQSKLLDGTWSIYQNRPNTSLF